ncbi:hypothetical protein PSTT_06325 [Puccinia striiformis]|uniref:Uncharacterized protein n=3 Tax=Puccinia striiformis TaxID=27350 RepID=A0A2S4VKR8_9BASI|nr:hypothetical protein PSTT_06325 [Puccinia striiformis]
MVQVIFLSSLILILIATVSGLKTIYEFVHDDTPCTIVHVSHRSRDDEKSPFRFAQYSASEASPTPSIKNISKINLMVESIPDCPSKSQVLRENESLSTGALFCDSCGWAIVTEYPHKKRDEREWRSSLEEMMKTMRGDPQVSPRTHTRPSSPSYHDSSTEFPMAPEENGQTDSNSTPREDPSTCASSKNGAHDRSAVEKVVNQDNHDVEKLTQGDTHSEGISEVDSEVEKSITSDLPASDQSESLKSGKNRSTRRRLGKALKITRIDRLFDLVRHGDKKASMGYTH